MPKLTVTLTNGRQSGRFPVLVKVPGADLGTAIYDNDQARHILKLDGATFLKHAHALTVLAATSPSRWYVKDIEVESEATERDLELLADIDRLQRELFDAHKEIEALKNAVSAPALESVEHVEQNILPGENLPEPEPEPAEPAPVSYTFESLKAQTYRANRTLAKDLKVPGYSAAKNEDELIALILAHVNTPQQ